MRSVLLSTRRLICGIPVVIAILTLSSAATLAVGRSLVICVSDSAPPAIKQAAGDIVRNAASIPALSALVGAEGDTPAVLASSEVVLKDGRNDPHKDLVVVGLPSQDPLLAKVWEHFIGLDETQKSLYAQGWGSLKGDLGTIESDWNPFLHSRATKEADYETFVFKLSGTDEAGVLAAVKSFEAGQDNGIVAPGPFTRPETTILDMDPSSAAPPFTLPITVPADGAYGVDGAGKVLTYAGWTQAPENEYRPYLDAGGTEPVRIWRAKYLQPDLMNSPWTPQSWVDGFQRSAYGNAVTIVEFGSAAEAANNALLVSKIGGWAGGKFGTIRAWSTSQPTDKEVLNIAYGKIYLFAQGPYLIMSSLPVTATAQIAASVR